MIYLQHIPVPITSTQHRTRKESRCRHHLVQGRAPCPPREQAHLPQRPMPQAKLNTETDQPRMKSAPGLSTSHPPPRLFKVLDGSHGHLQVGQLLASCLAGYIFKQELATFVLPFSQSSEQAENSLREGTGTYATLSHNPQS